MSYAALQEQEVYDVLILLYLLIPQWDSSTSWGIYKTSCFIELKNLWENLKSLVSLSYGTGEHPLRLLHAIEISIKNP